MGNRLREQPAQDGDPVVALLDGVPVENHATLAGRLVGDDPDNQANQYQPTEARSAPKVEFRWLFNASGFYLTGIVPTLPL
ncbi:MAG TPA: hypothetical protein VG097_21065 [Gemmata sp.]|nr:hypothetical protein [Gemmata sp.]